jgi:GNAT superfamily N-acetyltransferase
MLTQFISLAKQPEHIDRIIALANENWPIFVIKEPVSGDNWHWLLTHMGDFHFSVLDGNSNIVAAGHSIPFCWDGTSADLPSGFSGVIRKGLDDHQQGNKPNALSALSALVSPAARGQGLSTQIIQQMKKVAREHGLETLVAPVRPTLKTRYPLTPMARYIDWQRDDGSPFDPWIRVHWKMGAEILGVASESMVVDGSVLEWEEWTGLRFPESGSYIVPGALCPVEIDVERDRGHYVEPNVWMQHTV